MPDQKSNPPTGGQNQNSNIEITHQFPEEKPKLPEDSASGEPEGVKDIFEEGLRFEPSGTPLAPPKEDQSEITQPEIESPSEVPEPASPPQKITEVPEAPPPAPEAKLPSQESTEPSTEPPQASPELSSLGDLKLKDLELKDQEPQPQIAPPRKKSLLGLIIGIIIVFILLGGGGYAYFTYFAQKTITVALNVEDASIKIDGEDYTSKIHNQSLETSLSGDIHKFEVSKDDYFTYEKQIDISKLSGNRLEIDLRPYPTPEQLMKYPVDYLKVDFTNNKLYYRSNQGKTLYMITLDKNGNQEDYQALTPEIMSEIKNLIWSIKYNSVIIQIQAEKTSGTIFSEGGYSGIKTFIYNLENNSTEYWGNNIQEIAFSVNGEKIYYIADGLLMEVSSSTPTQRPEQILDVEKANLENPKIIPSPNDKHLALIPQFAETDKNYIYLFDTSKKELTELVSEGEQLNGIFSSDNSTFLYSTYDEDSENKSKLSVVDIDSKKTQDLNIQTEIISVLWMGDDKILYSCYNESSKSYEVTTREINSDSAVTHKFKSVKTLEITNLHFNSHNEQIYFINNNLIYHFKLDDGKY